ncbi:MAG: ATP synthase subunit I [Burkholderiaceae bacterium]
MTEQPANGTARNGFEDELDDAPVRAWTRAEAQALRASHPGVSPWRVVAAQVVVGAALAVLAWWLSGSAELVGSVLYGAATAVVPGALMARGMTRRLSNVTPGASAVGVLFWSLVKIGVSVLMLVLAPRLVQPLSWPALLAALVLCIAVYWFALLWRGR